MTKEELVAEYGENNVFDNQLEMAKYAQEYGTRHHFSKIEERWPLSKMKKDQENYFDFAEVLLNKGIAFANDGLWIIEDLDDVANI